MFRLLSIELDKIKRNKAAKVIIGVYFLLIISIALIVSIEFPFAQVNFRIAEQGIFNFPYIWHFNTYVAGILKIFLAIVIVSMMSNEYSYRTLKQNLIDGLSKKEFVLSKFITVVGFALVSTLFVFILSLLLGLIFSDHTEAIVIFRDLEYLLAYFVKLVGFFSFCLFLGILVKRSAFALGFLIIWQIIEGIIYALLKWQVFKNTDIADKIINFFPLEAMADLIVEPGSRLGGVRTILSQVGEEFSKSYAVNWYTIVIVSVWAALFIFGSYKILKRRDL
jgi:ABC-type transport system involved in multi-copper enzyme maturation permease subunit